MGKRIIATNKRTGSKYVVCEKISAHVYKVQTMAAYKTGSFWFINGNNLVIK